jgi:hypothetical protein
MQNYNPIYRKFIDEKNIVQPNQMVRAKFYLIKQYEYVDGHKGKYNETTAPIIFTLYVSRALDVVHAIKVTNIRPDLIKKFFGEMVNKDTELLEIKGPSSLLYKKIVKQSKIIKDDAYRTYKLSGFERILELDMEINKLTPRSKPVIGIDKKSQKQNK